MSAPFFIVGPTAAGKSELAADVAVEIGAEIVGADAFQVYREFSVLTSRPEAQTITKVPHHLIGEVGVDEEMNVERFRQMATERMRRIMERGKRVLVVGGSGLYIKALTHGLSSLPRRSGTAASTQRDGSRRIGFALNSDRSCRGVAD